jgi:hypothetical protein
MEPAVGSNYLLGRGNLYIDEWSGGVKTGKYRMMGNVPKFAVTTEDDVLEKNSSCEASAPLVLSIVRKRTDKFAITLDEFQVDNVKLGLMGSKATYSQTTGAVTGETLVAAVVKGGYYATANRRITAITVKKSPSTPMVLGTDYTVVDAEKGIIHILTTGGVLVDGDTVLIDYTKGTITNETRIAAGTATVIDASLLFVPDPANGPKLEIEVWHVQINVDGETGFITEDDTGQLQLTGKVISDAANHPTEPYFRVTPRP